MKADLHHQCNLPYGIRIDIQDPRLVAVVVGARELGNSRHPQRKTLNLANITKRVLVGNIWEGETYH